MATQTVARGNGAPSPPPKPRPAPPASAEEQAPAIYDVKPLARLLGLPALPVIFPQVVPFPLPVKYRLWFGEPMSSCWSSRRSEALSNPMT